ncbi:MAG: hypothetical protein HOO06_15440 [Bdellovibrionaceae bacterium]|nr:hypothetical protein [Pseudobdellovibrionaceae bacterium]
MNIILLIKLKLILLFTVGLCSMISAQNLRHKIILPMASEKKCLDYFSQTSHSKSDFINHPLRALLGTYTDQLEAQRPEHRMMTANIKQFKNVSDYKISRNQFLNKVFKNQQEERNLDQINLNKIRLRELLLSPKRTAYFSFNIGAHFIGARVFDGSTSAFSYSKKGPQSSYKQLPMQIIYPKLDPETINQHKHRLEVGLLNVPHDIEYGVEAIFRSISIYLDAMYNNSLYYQFRELRFINKYNPQIFITATKSAARLYERKAYFEYVFKNDQPVQVENDIYLMTTSLADFLRKNTLGHPYPKLKSSTLEDPYLENYFHTELDQLKLRIETRDTVRGVSEEEMQLIFQSVEQERQLNSKKRGLEQQLKQAQIDHYLDSRAYYSARIRVGAGPFKWNIKLEGSLSNREQQNMDGIISSKVHISEFPTYYLEEPAIEQTNRELQKLYRSQPSYNPKQLNDWQKGSED